MALTDSNSLRMPGLFLRARTRFRDWLDGDHAATRRMAGEAFVIRIASAAVLFVSQVLLARWMGANEFGTYVYVWTWLMLVGDLVHVGMPLTAQRYVPEYTADGRLDLLRGYLSGSCCLTFGLATAAAALGAFAVHAVEAVLDRNQVMPFYLACAALPFYALTFMLDGLARSYNSIRLALLPPYVLRPLLFIAMVAAARAAGFAIDATSTMGALAIATWLTALGQLVALARRLRTAVPSGRRVFELRQWLGTSLPIILVWGMYTLLTSTDVLVLKQFRPAEEVAHYYAAAKTLALISFIQFAVGAASAHRFTAYHVEGDSTGLETFAAVTVRWVFWPSVAACLVILTLGRPLLGLFGPGYIAAYPVMAILAIGQLARASVGPAERLLNMLGEQRICARAYAAAFLVNITTCLILAPVYGSIGAASATACAFVTESGLLFLIAKRRLRLHMFICGLRR